MVLQMLTKKWRLRDLLSPICLLNLHLFHQVAKNTAKLLGTKRLFEKTFKTAETVV